MLFCTHTEYYLTENRFLLLVLIAGTISSM